MKHILFFSVIALAVFCSCNTGANQTQNPIVGNSIVSSVSSLKYDVTEYELFMKDYLSNMPKDRPEVNNKLSMLIKEIELLKKDFEPTYKEIYQTKKSVLNLLDKKYLKNLIINDNEPILNVDFKKIPSNTTTSISVDRIYNEYELLLGKLTKRFKSLKKIELSSILEINKDIEKVELNNTSISNSLILLYSIEYEVANLETSLAEAIKYSFAYGSNDLGFDKIIGLAYPAYNVVNVGDEVEVMVMMAGFSSEKMPIVEPSVGIVKQVKNGVATIKVKALKEGQLRIYGTVGIADKRGNVKIQPYETRVTVVKN
jgi:hypothetical protein